VGGFAQRFSDYSPTRWVGSPGPDRWASCRSRVGRLALQSSASDQPTLL